MELGYVEILDDKDNQVEERAYTPEGYPTYWTEGTVVYGIRYSTYDIESDSLTIDDLTITPFKIDYKDQTIWEEDGDSEVVEVINL